MPSPRTAPPPLPKSYPVRPPGMLPRTGGGGRIAVPTRVEAGTTGENVAGLTLKARILLGAAAVNLLVLCAAGTVMLLNARSAVRTEVMAAQSSAVDLIGSNLPTTDRPLGAEEFAARFARLSQPRHVRIVLSTPDGAAATEEANSAEPPPAPAWFSAWIAPHIAPAEIIRPRAGGGENRLYVLAQPEDEVEEVWEDVRALALVWGSAVALQMGLLATIVSHALRPLAQFNRRLSDIGSGDLDTRIGAVGSSDLMPVARRIDALTTTLAQEQATRRQMAKRMLDLRDAERRDIARDLHDELGPRLFGLTVEADRIGARGGAELAGPTEAILRHVSGIRAINRRILNALRPVTLGHLPLSESLRDLVGDLAEIHPETEIDCTIAPDLPKVEESVALSVYRAIQEGVTNARRHGRAGRISILLGAPFRAGRRELELTLRDDGTGLGPGWRAGNGLMGMMERAEAGGGRLTIRNAPVADAAGRTGAELVLTLPLEG